MRDRPTNRPTDGPIKRSEESSARKKYGHEEIIILHLVQLLSRNRLEENKTRTEKRMKESIE